MRLLGIDLLRGIAAFGIVGCHLSLSPKTDAASWLLRFCDMNVAVFAVVAGYFTHTGGGGYLNRARRLLPTYLIWTVVFLAASFAFKILGHADLGQYAHVGFWTGVVFRGGSSAHLWFLICLLYVQIAAIWIMGCKNIPCAVPWILGVVGIVASVASQSWWSLYFARLWGFVWLGIALQQVRRGTWQAYLGCAAAGAVLHVALTGVVPGFLRDGLVAVPLVLGMARLPLDERFPRACAVAKALGTTSLGVYLVHPLLTRAGSVVVGRFCAAPYGADIVLLDWLLCWLVAFAFTVIALYLPFVRKFVR